MEMIDLAHVMRHHIFMDKMSPKNLSKPPLKDGQLQPSEGNNVLKIIIADAVRLARENSNNNSGSNPVPNDPSRKSEIASVSPPATFVFVGAHKGGVGKTTICKAIFDIFKLNEIKIHGYDTDPYGWFSRSYPNSCQAIDLTEEDDSALAKVSPDVVNLVDVGAGKMELAIALINSLKANHKCFFVHVISQSKRSLEEVQELRKILVDVDYILVKNRWSSGFGIYSDDQIRKYFDGIDELNTVEVPNIQRPEWDHANAAGASFLTIIANQNTDGSPASYPFLMQLSVEAWLAKVAEEFTRVGLMKKVALATNKN